MGPKGWAIELAHRLAADYELDITSLVDFAYKIQYEIEVAQGKQVVDAE